MNLFSSDAFLTTLAEVFFPGRSYAIGYSSVRAQVFRLLSIERAPPITCWDFMDSVGPVEGPAQGPLRDLRYLPRVSLQTHEVTAIPRNVINGPDYYPAPFLKWSCFENWCDFESHVSKRRHNLLRDSRSKTRHLEEAMGSLRFVFHDERPGVFDACVAWKSAQYVRTGVPDLFARPGNVQLFRSLMAKGGLAVSSLAAGDRLLAAHFGGLDGDRFYSWIAAYDPEFGRFSPGRLLLERMLRECQPRGFREFDFGIGHNDYKWFYATHNRVIGPLGRAPLSQRLQQGVRVNARRVLAYHPPLYAVARQIRRGFAGVSEQVHRVVVPGTSPYAARVRPGEDSATLDPARAPSPGRAHPEAKIMEKQKPDSSLTRAPAGGLCQLRAFPAELPVGPPSLEEPWPRYLRRRAKGFLIRLRRELGRLRPGVAQSTAPEASEALPAPVLQAGDRVRVRSASYIRSTLDSRTCLKGCGFSHGQYQYCDRELRVLRRVQHFFDEARSRMLRGHRLVLLEGAYCDGSSCEWTRGCDRMCFYFWRTEWLEKLEDATGDAS